MVRKSGAHQNFSLLKEIVLELIPTDTTALVETSLRLNCKRAI